MIKNNFLKLNFLFVLFGLNFFLSFNAHASDFEETFLKANDFYINKKYKEALDLYKSMPIDNKGSVIFYNIGNCEFKLGKYFDALINYSRAKKNASFGMLKNINKNISMVDCKLGRDKSESFWQKFSDFINIFSLFKLQILFIFFWFLFFISYIFLKKLRFVFLIINMFFIFIFGFFVFVKYRLEIYPIAISKSCVGVFYGPNASYHKLSDITIAERVEVKKTYKNWCKIKYNGITGWVLASDIEII